MVFSGIGSRTLSVWLVVAAALALADTVVAQPPPPSRPATAPSVGPGTDHLDLYVGVGVVTAPRPFVGTSEAIIPIPVVNVRYKRLFAEGTRGGVQFLREGRLSGNVYLQANFEGLEAEDSPFLAGMENRSMSADAGVEIAYRARPVGFRVAMVTDVLGRSNGQEISLQAVTGAPLGSRGFLLVGAGPRWVSANRVDYYYGVRADEATTARPAYIGNAAWNWDLTVGATMRLQTKWSLFALFTREAFGASIRNSPIVDRTSGWALISSLTYAIR